MEPIRSGGFFSTTNSLNILAAFVVGPFLVFPAYADIINVNFVGTGSGSGTVNIICDLGEGCSDSFSFSGTNTQLGTFSQSGQASAEGTNERVLTAHGLVQQTTQVTSNSFAIDLLSQFTIDDIAGLEWGVSWRLSNNYFMNFTLTTKSSMHVTSSLTSEGLGDVLFQYSDVPGLVTIPFGPLDQTLTLEPGPYQFEFFSGGSFQRGPMGGENDLLSLSLNADFTSIPEPDWTPIIAGLIGIGCCAIRQRQRARSSV